MVMFGQKFKCQYIKVFIFNMIELVKKKARSRSRSTKMK